MAKFLRVAQWNANGLHPHINEVKLFLKHNYIDVMLISETHCTDRTYCTIPQYNIYYTNHPDATAHAGTAIIIKQTISHYELPNYRQDYLQATSVNVTLLPFDLTISAVYCPPKHNNKAQHFSDFFKTLGTKFIVGGDFNSKHTQWGARTTTTKGRELLKVIEQNKYNYLTTATPTYWPTDPRKTPDVLDFFITRGLNESYLEITASYDLSSDHSPIIATISESIITVPLPPHLHTRTTNWAKYKELIHQGANLKLSMKTPQEIETATNTFITLLQQSAIKATPPPPRDVQTVEIPVELKQLIAQKRRARAKWQRTRYPDDKRIYQRLSHKLKTKLKEIREHSIQKYIIRLGTHDNSIWKPIKTTRRPKTAIPPIRNQITPTNSWAKSDQEKANLFGAHLAQVFSPHHNYPDLEITRQLQSKHIPPTHTPFTFQEVRDAVRRLNNKKSPGPDLITPRMLKELPKKGLLTLLYIFNGILRTQHWPKALKTAEIILLLKPGKDPTVPESYRPISLLPTISKIIERLLANRITTDVRYTQSIPDHQFGFRRKHSTIQQVHRLCHTIYTAFEAKQYCTSVFLDISQAFDKVWHDGLLYKVKHILPLYYSLMRSYLSARTFHTRVRNSTSTTFPINAGVPQGSVLGPILYVLYTSDLPTTNCTVTGTFADDTAIMAAHTNPHTATRYLQYHLDLLQEWLHRWRIKINTAKSVNITFTLRKGQCPPVLINNTELPIGNTVKYLGMHLDQKLTWKVHITKKRKQVKLKVKELHWLIGRKSPLTLNNKLLLYKSIIKPIWTYGIEIWGCASKSSQAILQKAQSSILRMMTDAPWYVTNLTLHDDLKIPFVHDVITERYVKHHWKMVTHPNSILQPLLTDNQPRRLKRTRPADLL